MSEETTPAATAASGDAAARTDTITQTPDTARAQAHLQTARDSHKGGAPLEECASWLALQGHDAYKDAEAAKAAILAD